MAHFSIDTEHDKTMALRQNKGNYQACIKLSQESLAELQWYLYTKGKD